MHPSDVTWIMKATCKSSSWLCYSEQTGYLKFTYRDLSTPLLAIPCIWNVLSQILSIPPHLNWYQSSAQKQSLVLTPKQKASQYLLLIVCSTLLISHTHITLKAWTKIVFESFPLSLPIYLFAKIDIYMHKHFCNYIYVYIYIHTQLTASKGVWDLG